MKALLQDYSFGIIPLRNVDGQWQSFIVQQTNSYWSFPKGHAEGDESAQQTAERELFEETGLKVTHYYSVEPLLVMYRSHAALIYQKEVTLFCALVDGVVTLCPIEVIQGHWVDVDNLSRFIVFDAMQPLLEQLQDIVKNLKN